NEDTKATTILCDLLALVSFVNRPWGRSRTSKRHHLTRQEPVEDLRRDELGVGAGVALGPDAGWTAGLAGASGNQLARPLQERGVHVEQRPAEADAAGIVVVNENIRFRRERLGHAAPAARGA